MGGYIGVDEHWRVYFDPEKISEWTPVHMATALYHEIVHLLRKHPERAKSMQAHSRIWNLAADAEINDDLKGEGLQFPDKYILPSTFGLPDGRLVEEYYNSLIENAQVIEVYLGVSGSGGDGSSPGDASSQADSDSSPGDSTGVMNGRCGSCATGKREEWEIEGPSPDDAPGISKIEADIIRQSVAEAIRDEGQKGRGTVPGHWDRWAGEFLAPAKVPWQRELSSRLKKSLSTLSGRVDYSYSRPSRRQAAFGKVVMPALRRPSQEVAVVVDTSGSMGSQDIQDALSEIRGILLSLGQRNGVTVLAVDADIHSAKKVFDVRQVQAIGGGGTDMRIGLEAVAKLHPRPGVCVVLTDGWTPWPEKAPVFHTIVALIGGDTAKDSVPGWARRVIVE